MTTADAALAIRWDHLTRILDQYGADDRLDLLLDHRYLLIERECSITGDAVEFSTHSSPSAAFHYSANQECPENWEPWVLIDLDTLFSMSLIRTYGVEVESVHKVLLLENT